MWSAIRSLMEHDEAGTFERLRAGRKELFEPEIARHHGYIFKLMGDGLLAEFGRSWTRLNVPCRCSDMMLLPCVRIAR